MVIPASSIHAIVAGLRAREVAARQHNHENALRIRELAWQSYQNAPRIAAGRTGAAIETRMFPFARDTYSNTVPLRRFLDENPLRQARGRSYFNWSDKGFERGKEHDTTLGGEANGSYTLGGTSKLKRCEGVNHLSLSIKEVPKQSVLLFGVDLVKEVKLGNQKRKLEEENNLQKLQQQKRGVDINLEFLRAAKRQLIAEEDELLKMGVGVPTYHGVGARQKGKNNKGP